VYFVLAFKKKELFLKRNKIYIYFRPFLKLYMKLISICLLSQKSFLKLLRLASLFLEEKKIDFGKTIRISFFILRLNIIF
jgi:hypothetical protein